MDFKQKVERLAKKIHDDTVELLKNKGFGSLVISSSSDVSVKPGIKYWKVDVGGSGKYMVEVSTEEIYGIKAYGVIHRGYMFGTLDTIDDYFWGDYRAIKIQSKDRLLKMTGNIMNKSMDEIKQDSESESSIRKKIEAVRSEYNKSEW